MARRRASDGPARAPGLRGSQLVALRKWAVESDPEETREAYARVECGAAEDCGCEACFNFASTRHLAYGSELLALLDWLGVDPLLESELRHDGSLGGGRHAYTACFYLVGAIAAGPATPVAGIGKRLARSLEPADAGIGVGFSADASGAPEPFRGHPLVRLEVSVVVPWVSNAPEPIDG